MNTTSQYPTAIDIVTSLISCQWQMCLVIFFHLLKLFLSSIPYIYLSSKITITQSLPLLDHPGHPSPDRSGLISQLWTSLLFWFSACITVSTVIHILTVFLDLYIAVLYSLVLDLTLASSLGCITCSAKWFFITSGILDLNWQ